MPKKERVESESEEEFSDSEIEFSDEGSMGSNDTLESRAQNTLSSKREEVEGNLHFLKNMLKELRRNGESFDEADVGMVQQRYRDEERRLQELVQMEERFAKRMKRLSGILDKRESVLNTLSATREGKRAMKNMPDLLDGLVKRQVSLEQRYNDMNAEVNSMLSAVEKI